MLANEECRTFVIDEVQKVPDLLSVVHSLIGREKAAGNVQDDEFSIIRFLINMKIGQLTD
ncbi:ATPase [Candidatus Scalindua japonica]|uniref:ATPase n=1 Tax=Candidatus Scalindua japonica TaxID=1284222 RepID=A0A286TY94_9BACT|nr:hypothetical protein [Candidatus Scalindua japonica]GAX60847.1 ATPase [Candidatus Scalindua japonica]